MQKSDSKKVIETKKLTQLLDENGTVKVKKPQFQRDQSQNDISIVSKKRPKSKASQSKQHHSNGKPRKEL